MKARIVVLLGVAALAACAERPPETERVVVATTTSVEDSGLLDVLIPAFEADNPGYSIQYMAVGSGQALELGRRGDVDVIIAHSPADELQFMNDGHGIDRRPFMYNEFVLLGPPADPAAIGGVANAAAAFRAIAGSKSPFISRGDDSGTHRREMGMWAEAGIEPGGEWYVEAGVGMGDALGIASERGAYILADIATYLHAHHRFELVILSRGDERLVNAYSVIRVADAAEADGAARFADWLVGSAARELVAAFGIEQVGQPFFVPETIPAAVR